MDAPVEEYSTPKSPVVKRSADRVEATVSLDIKDKDIENKDIDVEVRLIAKSRNDNEVKEEVLGLSVLTLSSKEKIGKNTSFNIPQNYTGAELWVRVSRGDSVKEARVPEQK
jgi:hypothetical protein